MSGQGDASAAAGAFGLSLSLYLSISVCLMRLVDAHLCRMETGGESAPSAGSAMEVSGDAGGAVPSHKRQASSNEDLEAKTRRLEKELENEKAQRKEAEQQAAKDRENAAKAEQQAEEAKQQAAKDRENAAKAEQRAAKLETELKVEKRVGACFGRQCGGVGLLTRCVRVLPFLQVGCGTRVELNYFFERHNCTSTCCSTSRMKRILQ
jgi:membrane protein involved in colicin uptake